MCLSEIRPMAIRNIDRRPCARKDATMAIAVNWPGRKVGGFCCPVPPEPRLRPLFRQRAASVTVLSLALVNGPITAEPCRAKTVSLPRASILFRPHRFRPDRAERNGGGAGYCPRVRNAYSTRRLSP